VTVREARGEHVDELRVSSKNQSPSKCL
jgi:hypothetical protein